jgi:Bacterial transcriptional activator domain
VRAAPHRVAPGHQPEHHGQDRGRNRTGGLWRDRPLADLAADYRFVEDAARTYEGQRLGVLEGRFEAAAALGELRRHVDELGG